VDHGVIDLRTYLRGDVVVGPVDGSILIALTASR
jgi:hypothetical protein